MVALPKRLKGSLTFSDSWICSLTMSARENVVLEGHTKELTSTTCMWNAQNIQVFLHRHESFSICAAGHETFTSTVPPEGSLATFSFDIRCQKGKLAVSPSKALSTVHTFTMSFKFASITAHLKAPCHEYTDKDRNIPFDKQASVVLSYKRKCQETSTINYQNDDPETTYSKMSQISRASEGAAAGLIDDMKLYTVHFDRNILHSCVLSIQWVVFKWLNLYSRKSFCCRRLRLSFKFKSPGSYDYDYVFFVLKFRQSLV